MPPPKLLIITSLRLTRTFSLTTHSRYTAPSIFDLAARSQTAETAYLRRGSKLSPIEFSPSLELLRAESELATGRQHRDPTATSSESPQDSSSTNSESAAASEPVEGAAPTLPPAASPSDFALHAQRLQTASPSPSPSETLLSQKDARIASLERTLSDTQAALRASQSREAHSRSGSTNTLLLLVGLVGLGYGLSVRDWGVSQWFAGSERGARELVRHGEHYARAMDPVRAEPRYRPPVGPGSVAVAAVEEGRVDGEDIPVAVISAAPVPGDVGSAVVVEGRPGGERGRGWRRWFWKVD